MRTTQRASRLVRWGVALAATGLLSLAGVWVRAQAGEPGNTLPAVADRERVPSLGELQAILTPFAVILPVNAVSTAVMITALFLIVIAELLNSAIEWTIDDISLEKRPFAKRAKDMGSAAVFLAYINCAVVWGLILYSNWGRIATLEFLKWPPPFLP